MRRTLALNVPALVAFSIVTLLLISPVRAQAPPAQYVPGEILIKFRNDAHPAAVSGVLAELGAVTVRSFAGIKASQQRISRLNVDDAVARYRKNPLIEFIEPNYIYRADEIPNDPLFGQLWGLHNTGQAGGTPGADIRAAQAWDRFTGSSEVVVAIIDTGVDFTHPDLAANIFINPGEIPGNGIDDDGNGFIDDVRGWDFVSFDNSPMDDHGHGTHVAGTVGAVGNNGIGVTGVNWHVRMLPLKFLDASGAGTLAGAVDCVEYATVMQARVMNDSWGGTGHSEALRRAIADAGNAGLLFVAAAGNTGTDNDGQPYYPASYDLPNIIAVAATDRHDALAGFSSYGAMSVDLAAPGDMILSCGLGGIYLNNSGTSMASPHVAGVCALAMGVYPGITAAEAKAWVLSSTDPLPTLAGKVLTGGRLNALRAITLSDSIPPAPVGDLAVFETGAFWADVRWTATGDDSLAGTAGHYDIRYSPEPITEQSFDAASAMSDTPAPSPAGNPEQARVTGLTSDTDYYFALKVRDEGGNQSPLSNVVLGRTLRPPAIGVSPDSLFDLLYTGQTSTQTLTIRNTGFSELSFRTEIGGSAKAVVPGGAAPPRMQERLAGYGSFQMLFLDEMESGSNGWTTAVYEGENLWHQTERRWVSPTHAWWCGHEAQGTYEIGSRVNTAVISPAIDLSAGIVPITLSFLEVYETEPGWDCCMVDASVNGGLTWIPLRGDLGTAPSGSSGGWIETSLDLSAYAGESLRLRFHFDTRDASGNDFAGWYFDDVFVHGRGWLGADPVAGVVPAGQATDLTVAFNAAGLHGGDHTGILSILSDDPLRPQMDVPVRLRVIGAPDIAVTPDALAFGSVFIGGSRADTVEVRNVGADTLEVSSLNTDSPQEFRVEEGGFTLEPWSTRRVIVTYVPADLGPDAGVLTIESNDVERPSWSLPLTGEGLLPPEIAVTPDSLFADLFTGGRETQVVTISNTGATDLAWSTGGSAARLPRRVYVLPERLPAAAEEPLHEARPSGAPAAGGLALSLMREPSDRSGARDLPAAVGPARSLTRELADLTGTRIRFDRSHGQSASYFSSILVADLAQRGAEVVDDFATITPANLSQFDLLWESGSYASWSPEEMDAVVQWVAAGGGLLVEGTSSVSAYNQMLSMMGAGIALVWQSGEWGTTGTIYPHQTTESVAGLCFESSQSVLSSLEPPAVLLARFSTVSLVAACAQAGLGRVLVVNDRIFANWTITRADNRLFGNQVWEWLAGGARLELDPASGVVAPGDAADLRVTFTASGLAGRDYLSRVLVRSNDPDESELVVPALLHVVDAPDLAVSGRVLTFGPVFVGASRSDTLVVSNRGTTLLTVSATAVDNVAKFSSSVSGFTLVPGATRQVRVTYSPTSVGPDSASLTFASDDPDEPVVTVALFGEGAGPPDISVEPDSVYAELLAGSTATRSVTVTNSGEGALRIGIRVTGGFDPTPAKISPLSGGGTPDETSVVVGGFSIPGPGEIAAYHLGREGHLPGVDRDHVNLGLPRSGTAKVLILDTASDVEPIRNLLLAFPDLVLVDAFSLQYAALPPLAFLLQYDSVVLTVGTAGYSFYGLGNVLADYVDAGGGVVMTGASFCYGWQVGGRFLNEGYSPFTLGNWGGFYQLGNYDATHPIMTGVQAAQSDICGEVGLAPGATWVAGFSHGPPFIATKGARVAAVNVYVANPGYWAGDIPLILHNAIRWGQSPSWLTVEPSAGVVPPGGSLDVSLLFDTLDLPGGVYQAAVEIASDDPDESVVEIPIHLHITGLPAINVSPSVLDFGAVGVGSFRTDTLFVSNSGTDSLDVSSIVSGNPAEFLVDGIGFSLAPGQARAVPVTYVPADPGADEVLLAIESNDPDEPSVTVGLRGTGVLPPDIAVEPDSVSAELRTGETATRTVTLTNTGLGDLRFDTALRGDEEFAKRRSRRIAAGAGTDAGPSPSNHVPVGVANEGLRYGAGHPGTLPGTDREHMNRGPARTGEVKLLLLDCGGSPQSIRDLLLAFPDMAQVDVREFGLDPPPLAELMPYDAVMVMISYSNYDAQALGDVLADYVDAGGAVVTTVASFVSSWAIRGRFLDEGYSPFTVASETLGYHVLFQYLDGHPIMRGVSTAGADLPGAVALTSGAHGVAWFGDNVPFVATTGSRVVAVNAFVAWPGHWAGDVPLILHNAVRWALGLPWLSADPGSGVVAPGASLEVSLIFDPGNLPGGVYHGTVEFSNNDPDEAVVRVDARLHVEGTADISVGGEPVTLESAESYFQTGDRTTHLLAAPVTPAAGGSFLLRAEGNYEGPGATATLIAEGSVLGSVGPIGIDCGVVEGTFAIGAADLEDLAADGLVSLEVQNAIPVDAHCQVSQHRVRLQYEGYSDSLDFGWLVVGQSRVLGVQISNVGTDMLDVSSIGTTSSAFTAGTAQMSLAPGESQALQVTFAAVGSGVVEGTLTLHTNDPDEGAVTVVLRGEGRYLPQMRVSPPSFVLQVPSGEQLSRILTIGNAGSGTLEWSVASSHAGEARVLGFSPRFPSTGAPGAGKEPGEFVPGVPRPEQLYRFPSLPEPPAAVPSRRASAASGDGGSRDEAPSLEAVLAGLDTGYQAVTGAIPNRYDFSGGETGTFISDGGSDMYDGGNYLGTDIAGTVAYANGVIASHPAFGGSGRYFTRKYPGLFVLGADLQNVEAFTVLGNLGADGFGSVDGAVLHEDVFGASYRGFLKRVYNTGDPSVNHLIIVEYNPALNQGFTTDTNSDYQVVNGLGAATRIYYLLYAGSGGSYIDNAAALDIMDRFLDAAGLMPSWLAASPGSGQVAPFDSVQVGVTIDATELRSGHYGAGLQVQSNDPLMPAVPIPVDLHVIRPDATFLRGDDDGSGEVNITDPIYGLTQQFAGGPSVCLDAEDTNDDGRVDIADPIQNLAYQYGGGPAPPAPFPDCGIDPTADSLDCWSHPVCDGVVLPATRSFGEEVATVTLTLGDPFVVGDGRVGYPVTLETDVPLWGFECAVRCLPAGPVFAGVFDSGCDYSQGQMDATSGRVRVGSIFRLNLSEALPPGAHEVGYLAFDSSPGQPLSALEFLEGTYVAEGGGSGAMVGGFSPSSAWDAAEVPDRLVCRVVPNPFGSSTVVRYAMPAAGLASVEIYSATGQRIRRLGQAPATRGWHQATWDGTSEAGKPVAGGIYFVRVRAGGETETERVILLR